MKASTGWLSRKRRREAAYQRGYEAGLSAAKASCEPIAYLRHGEETFVQNVPFGAMWISDKDDPRAFPVYERPQEPTPSVAVKALELDGVPDALEYGKGIWRTCTGCHESNEGYPTGPFSDTLKCHLGGGCFECGGIGAVWDTTDYEDMGNFIALSAQAKDAAGYQSRVEAAHHALFHDDPTDIAERNARSFEESIETAQAFGMTEGDAIALVKYTFSRPVGDPAKELGAKVLTAFSLGVVAGIDVMAAAEAELEKLQQPETIARIRAKRSTRHGRGPLPGFDPAAPLSAQVQEVAERKPLDLNITKEWFEKRAALEGDHEIGAGRRKLTASIDPTPEELAELHRLAHRIPEGWQLVPIEPTQEICEAPPSLPAIHVIDDLPLKKSGWSMSAIVNRKRYLAMLAAARPKQESGE